MAVTALPSGIYIACFLRNWQNVMCMKVVTLSVSGILVCINICRGVGVRREEIKY